MNNSSYIKIEADKVILMADKKLEEIKEEKENLKKQWVEELTRINFLGYRKCKTKEDALKYIKKNLKYSWNLTFFRGMVVDACNDLKLLAKQSKVNGDGYVNLSTQDNRLLTTF